MAPKIKKSTFDDEYLLEVKGLCKYFPVHSKGLIAKKIADIKACDDINFKLRRGETLSIVGESGCGKTTTVRSILRAIKPTAGKVTFKAFDTSFNLARMEENEMKLLRTKIQMIFQDPFSSLNPRMTVADIVGEPLIIHKIGKPSERNDRVKEILRKVGLKPEHMNRYPHAFSGGQRQRIGIARALILHPSLVVCDEAVSALDVSVQAQVINLLNDLQKLLNLTYIFVAHDLSVVKHISDRVMVMYAGRVVELSSSQDIFSNALHPYTKALISAVPYPDPDREMNFGLSGEVADPGDLPKGCSFHPRCDQCMERCRTKIPKLKETPDGRFIACHLFDK